jgi:hypothetical protein
MELLLPDSGKFRKKAQYSGRKNYLRRGIGAAI